MPFADHYLKRFKTDNAYIKTQPASDLDIVTVIPSYNEPELLTVLKSLLNTDKLNSSIEIIVVINQSEADPKEHKLQNEKNYSETLEFAQRNSDVINCYVLFFRDLPEKYAGVGLARKKGMDEAVRRFNKINKPTGVITCTDADCTVKENYFKEINNYFLRNTEVNGVSIHYEHPLYDAELSDDDSERIISYELHLRYYNQALRYIGYPFAFQTIGSSFGVRAESYAKHGGMNKKKAGEDFYFLQKIIMGGNYHDLNTTTVYPSGRTSDRVPFGTGAAVKKLKNNDSVDFMTYDFQSFLDIGQFLNNRHFLFSEKINYNMFSSSVTSFLEAENFMRDLEHIKKISTNIKIFDKHFFSKFNLFKIVKYLNYARENYYPPCNTFEQALKQYKKNGGKSVFENSEELLKEYRNIAIKNPKKFIRL